MKISKELEWMIKASKVTKEYDDCIKREFIGRLPYRMVMNAILKNKWNVISENNKYWNVGNNESNEVQYFLHYTMKTGIVEFAIFEAKTKKP